MTFFSAPRTAARTAILAGLVVFLSACGGAPQDAQVPGPGSGAEIAQGGPPDGGSPDGRAVDSCVNGWERPIAGSEREARPIQVLRRTLGFKGDFKIEEMRYFEGPESPPSDKGYLQVVERWYVKGHPVSDPSLKARFLVEERTFGAGLVAAAPYGTSGYRSPDWIGFQYDASRPGRRPIDGLPGKWPGEPYDFVTGSEELDIRIEGLPGGVVGCLTGT